MGFQFDLAFLVYELGVGIKYIPIVLLLSIVPLIIGLFFGTGIGIIRLFKVRVLAQVLTVIVVFLRGVPLLLQLTILYLTVTLSFDSFAQSVGLTMTSKDISYTLVAVIGLSINATVYLSEVVRTALQSVNSGQYEAAYSVGMTSWQMLQRIVIPQAMPVAIPLIGSQFISLIKGSAIASLISVVELVNATLFEASGNYKFLEAYLASAIIYWALCICVEWLVIFLQNRIGVYSKGGVV
ncbi:amino acid ABC transporter permease [Pelosinus sp. sgz500959]|uniref:amino acid ABC transporter permease n=1 Tax=Pelosinus sp. sgz500959 TaxID=3242472 RepID=UPI00366F85C4